MSRLAAAVLCAATVACGSSAPNPSPAPHDPSAPPPPTLYALTGRVTDATTSLPIASALVEATNGENVSRSTTTDGTGAFRIAGLSTAGYTVSVRRTGYDTAFRGIGLNGADQSADFQLAPLMTTLSGTWTGLLEYSPTTGPRQSVTILSAPLTQAGASLSSGIISPPSVVGFSGTLQNPSAIGSTTGIAGTLTMWTVIGIFRGATSCQATTPFAGTTNWTGMSITASQITFNCGTTVITYTNVVLSLDKQQ